MNKILVFLFVVPAMLCGCKPPPTIGNNTGPTPGPTPSPDAGQIVGSWKVDMAHSTVPTSSEQAKAEEAAMRMEFKADGSYETSGVKSPDHGRWVFKSGHLFTQDDKRKDPLELTVSPDGATLTLTVPSKTGTNTVVFVKA
jgi:hypothetical protein